MVAIDWRRFLLFHYSNACFVTLATLLSTISFSFSPSAVPLALNLATLLVYSRIVLPRARALKNVSLLLTGLTLGSAIPKLAASWAALSSPGISLLVLFAGSGITSLFSVCAVLLDAKICMHFPSPWTQITIFPALWASIWSCVAYLSPIGRLSAWTPTQGIGAYAWLVPFLGPAAVDWAVAAWAVVLSQAVAAWFMSENNIDEVEPLVEQQDRSQAYRGTEQNASHTRSSMYLAAILAALAVPSLFMKSYPDPVLSIHTTPLSVGCVLPPFWRYRHLSLSLEDYIEESKKLTMSAEVLLWPEGAVVFNNESARDEAFAEVRKKVTGSYVGVSFEEMFPDPNNNTGTKGARRNGIALISKHSNDSHLVYYKRKLVPIAESFSLTHSNAPPGMYTIDLPHPKGMNKTDWAPEPHYTRPISVTTSICLDFTAPDLFGDLPSRPSLILAPARTWNVDIGIAMWNQAKQRANELGTMILWCDGGEGGVSGVAGQGYHDVHQVGPGSWIRKVGIDYPHQESRTMYAVIGSYNLLFFWLIALGASASTSQHTVHFLPGGGAINRVRDIGSSIMSRIRRRREGRILLEEGQSPPLVDLE